MGKRGPKPGAKRAALAAGSGQAVEPLARHWVLAVSPVAADWETENGWREHVTGIEGSLMPEGEMEAALVERIAMLVWRLRRVVVFERDSIVAALAGSEWRWEQAEDVRKSMAQIKFYGTAFREQPDKEMWMREDRAELLIPKGEDLERVLRYEAHLHRQLVQTMHELEALQARRKGEGVTVARVDVAGGPGG